MDGTGDLFESFVAALDGEFRVNVVRYPLNEPLGYGELETIARAALPAEGPFVLLGESFSGPIAVSLAGSASKELKGLILCCTFVRTPIPVLARFRWLFQYLPLAIAPVGVLSRLVLGRFSDATLRAALARSIRKVSRPALKARVRAVLSVDATAKLSAVTVPILYLLASRDRLVPASACALVSRIAPSTRVVRLEAPHFLLQAVPSEAAQVIRAFMQEM